MDKDNHNNQYKYMVTFRYHSGIAAEEFSDLNKAIEYFWSIRYKAYSIIKCDAKTNIPIENINTGVKV